MKRLIYISSFFLFAFLSITPGLYAQFEAGLETAHEAIQFSQFETQGSTRIQSIGGAQTALGGDISNAAGNPAGLGFFNKSEFTFTPTISFNNSKSKFLQSNTNDVFGNLNINNFGFVFSKAKDPIVPGKWRGGSFSVSYNTTNNFNTRLKYSGRNDNNSITDYFAEQAYDRVIHYEDLQNEVNKAGDYLSWEALAFGTYLIDVVDADSLSDVYYTFIENESVNQSEVITTSGSKSQWNFGYGGNYNDKIYFGASLGLASFRHKVESNYKETVLTQNDQYDDINNFTIDHTVATRGSGINLTAGVLYRINDYIRLGASVQTPTYFYSVKTQDDADAFVVFNDFEYNNTTILEEEAGKLETVVNNYKFTTPWKLSGGIAYFFNKNGFISADLDWISYDRTSVSPSDQELVFNEVNTEIRNSYKSSLNFRVGGEYRVSIFRLRAGYGNYGSPVKGEAKSNINPKPTHYASAGLGMRFEKLYLDFGVVQTLAREFNYYPYLLGDFSEPVANVTSSRTKAMFTLGFFF